MPQWSPVKAPSLLVGSAALSVVVLATPVRAEPPAQWGGFGYATVGAHGGSWADLQSDLQSETAMGSFFEINPLSLQLGGGGRAFLFDGLMVGGKGFGWFLGGEERDGATVGLSGGGGGFDLGYAVYNLDHLLVYPLAGLSAFGVTVDVQNDREADFVFGRDGAVAPGQAGSFGSGFLATEFGVGIQRMVMMGSRTTGGGLLVGFEAGFYIPVVQGSWSDGDDFAVAGVDDFGVAGGYLRMTIGGGGFLFDPDPVYERRDAEYEDEDLDAYGGDSFRDE